MASTLPPALRNLKVDFEPLDSTNDESASPYTTEERDSFVKRIERLAYTYLYKRQLFVQTASLKGPFDGAWADSNPWTSKPNLFATVPRVDVTPTKRPDTLEGSVASKSPTLPTTVICNRAQQTNNNTEEVEAVRPVKRRRRNQECKDGQHKSVKDDVRDLRHEYKDLPPTQDLDEESKNINGSSKASRNQHTPEPLQLRLVYNNVPINELPGNRPQNLLTPSDSEHATPFHTDRETDYHRKNAPSLELFARDKACDRTEKPNESKTKLKKDVRKKRLVSSRETLSQPLPETASTVPHACEPCIPSTLPTMDSIKTNEKRHKRTMERIFPKPIEALERAVGDWAYELRPSPRCKKEAFTAIVPSMILPDIQSFDIHTAHTKSSLVECKVQKHQLNKPKTKRRFMTFDTPPVPAQETSCNSRVENQINAVGRGDFSDTGKHCEQASRSLVELPMPTSCVGNKGTARHDDRLDVLDHYTNTVMSPAEAVRMKRLARKSGASLSSTEFTAANNGANATKNASPYVSTQVEWEQAYQAFQEGLSSPVKQTKREQGSVRGETISITPFSRFESPGPRTPPPIHEIPIDDEVQVMNTQELFDAVPVFSMGSARSASFAPQEQTEEVVAQSFGPAAGIVGGSGSVLSGSRPRSSHINPRSIMKSAPNHSKAVQLDGSPGMSMELWLEEAESFLAPFDIEAEMNKAGQGTAILSQ